MGNRHLHDSHAILPSSIEDYMIYVNQMKLYVDADLLPNQD